MMDDQIAIVSFARPAGYDAIVRFAESDRSDFEDLTSGRPNQKDTAATIDRFLLNLRFENSAENVRMVEALGMQPSS